MKKDLHNPKNEKLDVLIEGKSNVNATLIMVHGFGTNKDEGFNLFSDISKALQDDLRVIRFDFSGYGQSEGKQADVSLLKHSKDLETILEHVKREYGGSVYLLAHSLGTFVTALLSSEGISKTVFTGIPNSDTKLIIRKFEERLSSKDGAVLNKEGISIYPRTSGEVQELGAEFWKILEEFKPINAIEEFSKKTSLLIIHPLQDEIIGNESIEDYKDISNVKYKEIDGDHNFTKPEDRETLIKLIKRHFWILPNIIKEVGFDFRWNEKKVWELEVPVEEIDIKELEWHFDIPFWFKENGFYDQTPREVIEYPKMYPERYKRIMDTNLTYPLDIMWNKGRWVLLDGLHRLTRLYIEGNRIVKVRKIPLDKVNEISK